MQRGEPSEEPVWVTFEAGIKATPKSVSFARPEGATTTLAGLTSRWTIENLCACSSASATWAAMSKRSSTRTSSRSSRSEEHTSELQSQSNLVCRLLLEKKK